MIRNHRSDDFIFAPLVTALELIGRRLSTDYALDIASDIIVATPTLDELLQKKLPPHIETSVKKRKGPRISKRGSRHTRLTRLVSSHWLGSQQWESTTSALAYVLKGQADFHIEDYLLYLQQGDFLHIPAGIAKPDADAFYVLDGSDRECDLLWISPLSLKGDGLECWVCHTENGKKHTGVQHGSSLIKNRFLASVFDELDGDLQERKPSQLRLHLLSSMIFMLKRELEEARAELPQSRRLHQPVEQRADFIEEACEYIESNIDSSLTISRVSQAIGVSPATLTRYFRSRLNCSFNEYLTQKRLEAAESYLLNTTLSVSRIAHQTGIRYDQLRVLFHKNHNCSPGEFRRQRIL